MIRFTLRNWLSPKLASAGVPAEEAPDTVDDPSDEPLVLEPPEQKAEVSLTTDRALVRAIVEASVDQASGQAAYHMRQILKSGLTEDLTAFVDFMWAQTGQEPTEASIREMLPHVRRFRGDGIKADYGLSITNLGRRYMTDERCKRLQHSLATT
ncbi:hypothetical protein [Sandarakinorhabdus sp.]|uniref:hypothetical protein n=1 Tax=Sandarakinorhabdus sp. TaxID=1916663 RepID=UPI0033418B43